MCKRGLILESHIATNLFLEQVKMSRSKLSLGSMETYEPEDKSFSKHMFQDGTGDTQPNEGSVCRVIIRPVGKS